MALLPATVTALENRHGSQALIQLTNRDTYDSDSVLNEDVLETAVNFAVTFVRERGVPDADETFPQVQDIVKFFLLLPGTAERMQVMQEWEATWTKIRPRSGASATTAVPATSEYSRRVFTQADYYADVAAGVQRGYRPARGSW